MGQGSYLWYILFPIVLSILAAFLYKSKNGGKVFVIILLFFSMFRGDNVGNDTKNYLDPHYIYLRSLNVDTDISGESILSLWGERIEFGSALLNGIVYSLDLHPRIIVFAYSIITLLFLYYALKKFKVNSVIALLMYVLIGQYFFSLSAARQMAAVSVFLFGLTFLFEQGKRKYLFSLYAVLGTSIHASCIFFIWIYFLRYLRIKKSVALVLMSVTCALMVISSINIMDYVYRLFSIEYVQNYSGFFDSSERSLLGRIIDVINFGFLIYVFSLRNHCKECDLRDILFVLAVLLYALFGHSSLLVARITFYITIFICVYISQSIIEARLLKRNSFFILLFCYWLIHIYGLRVWGDMLTSGYYLMF